MRILAINGSPRTNGNTSFFLNKALEGAGSKGASVEMLEVSELKIVPIGADDYDKTIEKALPGAGEGFKKVMDSFCRSDAVIIGSPVFFGSIPGQLKVLIDRFQSVWLEKELMNRSPFPETKRGALISVQAQDRNDFHRNSSEIIKHFFATVNIVYTRELFCSKLEDNAGFSARGEYASCAFELGAEMAQAQ